MCNPIAVVGTLAGAVIGKKAGEAKKKQETKKQQEIKKSKEMEKSNISNPLIPDTFQARVRLGETRDYEAPNNRGRYSNRYSSGYQIGNNRSAQARVGKAIGRFMGSNPFLGGRG